MIYLICPTCYGRHPAHIQHGPARWQKGGVYSFDGAKKDGPSFEVAVFIITTPDRPQLKIYNNRHPPLQKRDAAHHHQGTQADDRSEYTAVLVSVPSNSHAIFMLPVSSCTLHTRRSFAVLQWCYLFFFQRLQYDTWYSLEPKPNVTLKVSTTFLSPKLILR